MCPMYQDGVLSGNSNLVRGENTVEDDGGAACASFCTGSLDTNRVKSTRARRRGIARRLPENGLPAVRPQAGWSAVATSFGS